MTRVIRVEESMDVQTYLRTRKEALRNHNSAVKNFSVFDFNYIPDQPLMRDEAKTIIDAILDRLVHNAYKITLKGESMRKRKSLTKTPKADT